MNKSTPTLTKKQATKGLYDKELVRKALTFPKLIRHYGLDIFPHEKVRCPFHGADKKPSATIKGDFFHCFTCGESLDHFAFIQKMEGCTFTEALATGAELCGIAPTQGKKDTRKLAIRLAMRIEEEKHNHSEACRINGASDTKYRFLAKVARTVRPLKPSWLTKLDDLLDVWLKEVPLWVDLRPLAFTFSRKGSMNTLGFSVCRLHEEMEVRACIIL